MNQTLRVIEHIGENRLGCFLRRFICAIQAKLAEFDVPVAEIVPDKVIQQTTRFTELIAVDQTRYISNRFI